jgi:hypothetical protein
MISFRDCSFWAVALFALATATGCNSSEEPAATDSGNQENPAAKPVHAHDAPHGGFLAILGNHEYHAEIVADPSTSQVCVYLTDAHFGAVSVTEQELSVSVLVDDEPRQYDLSVDADSEVLRFITTDEKLCEVISEGWQGDAQVFGTINGTRYSGRFERAAGEAGHEEHDHKEHAGEAHEHSDSEGKDEHEGHEH